MAKFPNKQDFLFLKTRPFCFQAVFNFRFDISRRSFKLRFKLRWLRPWEQKSRRILENRNALSQGIDHYLCGCLSCYCNWLAQKLFHRISKSPTITWHYYIQLFESNAVVFFMLCAKAFAEDMLWHVRKGYQTRQGKGRKVCQLNVKVNVLALLNVEAILLKATFSKTIELTILQIYFL